MCSLIGPAAEDDVPQQGPEAGFEEDEIFQGAGFV